MNVTELTALIGACAVLIGAVVALLKIRPDRDAIMITQAQGASTILNDLIDTLREEVERERKLRHELETENKRLRDEVEGLRKKYGQRASDSV